jgi:proteasome lid subunit RPN8/RPN11
MNHQSKSAEINSAQEIELGEVQQAPLLSRRRPDADKQYAVTPVFAPNANDLAIFVDLDTLREMEVHAATDTSVELGGVLLGGQYQDESGHPFVLVTDCLRAEHYEATKGSFKFTHDTWQQITRRRAEFSEELQMVGWYHTHPDWGVFLSSMDLFICENFFNKSLDLALVIDPCRHSLGFFQWAEPGETTRRVDGFYLVASRFREAELTRFVEWIEEKPMLSNDPRFQGTANPIVQLHNQSSSVYTLAVLGTLAIQFCLLAVIAWRVLSPSPQVRSRRQPNHRTSRESD